MKINIEEIAVKIKFTEQKILKAIIGLDFGDFSVKGFRIMESQFESVRKDKLWLTPPSYRDMGGRYHPIFFIPDKELWEQLEAKIYEEYFKHLEEHHKKQYGIENGDI